MTRLIFPALAVGFLFASVARGIEPAKGGNEAVAVRIETELKEVSSFRRRVLFCGKDRMLWLLDTAESSEPRRLAEVLRTSREVDGPIGVFADESAFAVTDGHAILRVSRDGKVEELGLLPELFAGRAEIIPDRYDFGGFIEPSRDGRFLYFGVLSRLRSGDYAARLEISTKRVDLVPVLFPTTILADGRTGRLYYQYDGNLRVVDFERSPVRMIPLSNGYVHSKLSADGKSILLSFGPQEEEELPIAILELESGKEQVLPVRGSYAVWASDQSVCFIRSELELWKYTLGEAEPRRVMAVGDPAPRAVGSYVKPPDSSADGTWLNWPWSALDESGKAQSGTMLIDLKSGEYRRLPGFWWHNVAWVKP